MANLIHFKCFIVGIVSIATLHAQVVRYLEDSCQPEDFNDEPFSTPNPFLNYSSVYYFQANKTGSYSTNITCNLCLRLLPSAFDFIISVKRVRFRIACQDFLKVTDDNGLETVLQGFRTERDRNMQFYGKRFLLKYSTEQGGTKPLNYIGFSLSVTIAQKDVECGRLHGFRCANGYCIDRHLSCDGYNNCGDFSDEDQCGKALNNMDSTPGTVILISMFLMSIIGLVGGCLISMCFSTFIAEMVKLHRAGRRSVREPSIDSNESSSSSSHFLTRFC